MCYGKTLYSVRREIQTVNRLPCGLRLQRLASNPPPLKMTRCLYFNKSIQNRQSGFAPSLFTFTFSLTKVRYYLCDITGAHNDYHILFGCVFVKVVGDVGELCNKAGVCTERIDLIGKSLA